MLKEIDTPHEFFLKDPKLCNLGLPDEDLVSLHKKKKLVDIPESQWYGVYHRGEELLGVVRTEPYDEESIILHLYVATKYRSTGVFQYMAIDIIIHLLENTEYKTMIVPVPEPCIHVQKAMDKIGFEFDGVVTEDYIWRDQKVNLLSYSKELRNNG